MTASKKYLPQKIQNLVEAAQEASRHAHAPYSKFYVGALAVLKSGEHVTASNLENVSYGLCSCAERNLVSRLHHDGLLKEVELLVVYTPASPPAAPCGMCRQVLAEFFDDLEILICNDKGEHQFVMLRAIFPQGFNQAELASGIDD